ncbi:response regulator [Kallotenue papyrolyticum]|uniref:response regulator n=1 Tax=Kallotenue papyrolyticum TaxID=1325125 RepID=UPI00047867A3|nr:response regulator transcription factor [Kallotenue papyrolyticum]
MISLIIADDHPVVRAGVRAMLEAEGNLRVVAEIGHGAEIDPTVARHCHETDLLLLDARMPGLEPIAAVRALSVSAPELKVLVLSSYDESEYVTGLLHAGARGYILKDEPRATLIAAIRTVADGDMYLSPKVAGVYVRHQRQRATERDRLLTLTERELEVLRLVGAGYDNQAIGAALTISYETVKHHLRNIYGKLGLTNRYQAIVFAFRNRLVASE